MDFLNTLEENDKMLVEVIIEEDQFNVEEKLLMLKDVHISDEVYEKVKAYLTKEEKIEDPADFISLMPENKKCLANLLLENKQFTTLDSIISKQSEECQKAYEVYKKQQKAKEEEKKENIPMEKVITPKNEEKAAPNILDSTDEEISDEETESEPQWSPGITPEFFDQFPQCLNILVLGETGVGKSTFINGLANYLKYSNMHEAKKHGVEILIRSSFIHMDEDYNKMRVECDPTIEIEDENENTADGQSSTQSPKAYQFEWGPMDNRKKIRIIDTPGVGDVRGLEQEQMNFAKILSFIADYPEIHAILILMKPNNARLTVTYRYCINELLTHLHVSASKNILFCFTNARQTLYKPGDTMPALESHLEELYKSRGVRIPLQNDTVYCFDNESFRFLCAWKQGATFEDKDIENFDKSWKTTVEETFRLFKKISQLPTHKTEETLSVNNIRQVILAMARPLAEIAKNQMINAQLIDEKVKEVEDLMKQGKSLGNSQLYVEQVIITPREVDHPITVCTNEKCVEVVKLNGTVNETYYKQKCHAHCYLTGVQTGLVPNPQLQGCACFHPYGIHQCNVCGCDWTTHLHIRYELIKTMDKVIDPTVQDSIKNCDDKIYTAQLFIDAEKRRKAELEDEANTIRSHCADFAAFLKKNSIIPYNDVYKEYVEHLIREENGKVSHGASNRMLLQLQKYRDEYEQQVKILESHGTTSTSNKDIRQINEMLEELKQMKNCGSLLQEIEKLEMLSVRKEQTNRVTNVNIKKGWMNGLYDGVASFFKKTKKPKNGKKGRKSVVKFEH